jgi:2-haloalkanoic acid dehalogenase type II
LSGYCAPTRGVAIEIGVVVFDVNETLLRLDTLRAGVLLAAPGVSLNTWFARTLQNAKAASITDQYAPFDEQAIDALIEEASGVGAEVDRSVARQVVAGFKELAPHSDARPALDTLSTAGFRLAALSNSSTVFLNAQIAHSGLDGYFERLISVDAIHRFKPDAEVYRHDAVVQREQPPVTETCIEDRLLGAILVLAPAFAESVVPPVEVEVGADAWWQRYRCPGDLTGGYHPWQEAERGGGIQKTSMSSVEH